MSFNSPDGEVRGVRMTGTGATFIDDGMPNDLSRSGSDTLLDSSQCR